MSRIKTMAAVLFSALFALGCATTSYVNKKVRVLEEADRANGEKISALQARNVTTEERMQEALKTAMEAKDEASRAAALRAAFSDYSVIMEKELRFRFDSYQLTDVSKNVLDQLGQRMKDDKSLIVEIEGYTDPTGSDAYNLTLGQNRARAAEQYLSTKYEIPLFRLFSLSYGKSKLKAPAETGEGNAANRRVVIRLLGPPSQASQ